MSQQHCRMLQVERFFRQSQMLLRHCCWCGRGFNYHASTQVRHKSMQRLDGTLNDKSTTTTQQAILLGRTKCHICVRRTAWVVWCHSTGRRKAARWACRCAGRRRPSARHCVIACVADTADSESSCDHISPSAASSVQHARTCTGLHSSADTPRTCQFFT